MGIYTCGPTVYGYAHLGNFRAYLFADSLRRMLEYLGLATKHVMNITDVGHLTGDVDEGEDKVELAARAEGKTAWEIASFYTDAFLEDSARLNITKPHVIAKATAHIPEQIVLVKTLEEKGYAYRADDGVYFDTSKFTSYGPLTGQSLEELQAGARVEENPSKRHPFDFALWKFSKPGEQRQMEWESPWGVGYPGWHIECSAMSTKYLGQPFDIHTGGIDHVFPHHTNEIAQSEAATGEPLAKLWLHNEFMTVDGQKMSKSLGNTYTLQDLVDRGHDPLAFRYFALGTHYRKPLNFTWEAIKQADQGLANLRAAVRELEPGDGGVVGEALEAEFRRRIADDIGAPQALALLWETLRSDRSDAEKAAAVRQWDQFFGLGLADELGKTIEVPAEVEHLVSEREAARSAQDFARSDALRREIANLGYTVDDTPQGPKIRPLEHPTEI